MNLFSPPLNPPILGEKGKLGDTPESPGKVALPLCTPRLLNELSLSLCHKYYDILHVGGTHETGCNCYSHIT